MGMKRRNRNKNCTVWFREEFDGEDAAEKIKKAIEGWGTDEGALVKILGSHCAEQRIAIAEAFKSCYGEDLKERMLGELSGEFETVVVALLDDPAMYHTRMLHDAMDGIGTSEDILIEILTTKTNEEIDEIKELYEKEYETTLEDDISSDCGGYFKRMLISLVNGSRCENFGFEEDEVQGDVDAFLEAGEKAWGTDESAMNKILCQRSKYHLLEFFKRYEEAAEKTIEESIESECGEELQKGFLAIVETIKNTPRFFAKMIHECCSGAGTSDDRLIRIIVARSEIDMIQIKYEYEQLYETTLEAELEDETAGIFSTGPYCKMLLALIGVDPEDGECDED